MTFRIIVENTDPQLQIQAILDVADQAVPVLAQADFAPITDVNSLDKQLCFDRAIQWNSTLALYFFAKYGTEVLLVIKVLLEDVDEAVLSDARNPTLRKAAVELNAMRQFVKTILAASFDIFDSLVVRAASPRFFSRESLLIIQQAKMAPLTYTRRLEL